uniref:RIIa domain-containing protein n=1 Tax=Anopheles dirus TaxID=7168 RepID=A0A182NCV2_9DIPT
MPISAPKIPDGLPELMRGLAKSVIKENPENLYVHAAEYFENLIRERDGQLDSPGYQTFNAYQVYADYKEKTREKLGLPKEPSLSDGNGGDGDESGSGGSESKLRGRKRRRARKPSSREKDNPATMLGKQSVSDEGEPQKMIALSDESAPVPVVEQEIVKVHYNPPEASPSPVRVVSAQSVEAEQAVSSVLDDDQILDSDGTGGKETGDELVEKGDDVGTAPSTAEITEPSRAADSEVIPSAEMALQDMETCFMHANVDDLLEKRSEDRNDEGNDSGKVTSDTKPSDTNEGEDIPEGPLGVELIKSDSVKEGDQKPEVEEMVEITDKKNASEEEIKAENEPIPAPAVSKEEVSDPVEEGADVAAEELQSAEEVQKTSEDTVDVNVKPSEDANILSVGENRPKSAEAIDKLSLTEGDDIVDVISDVKDNIASLDSTEKPASGEELAPTTSQDDKPESSATETINLDVTVPSEKEPETPPAQQVAEPVVISPRLGFDEEEEDVKVETNDGASSVNGVTSPIKETSSENAASNDNPQEAIFSKSDEGTSEQMELKELAPNNENAEATEQLNDSNDTQDLEQQQVDPGSVDKNEAVADTIVLEEKPLENDPLPEEDPNKAGIRDELQEGSTPQNDQIRESANNDEREESPTKDSVAVEEEGTEKSEEETDLKNDTDESKVESVENVAEDIVDESQNTLAAQKETQPIDEVANIVPETPKSVEQDESSEAHPNSTESKDNVPSEEVQPEVPSTDDTNSTVVTDPVADSASVQQVDDEKNSSGSSSDKTDDLKHENEENEEKTNPPPNDEEVNENNTVTDENDSLTKDRSLEDVVHADATESGTVTGPEGTAGEQIAEKSSSEPEPAEESLNATTKQTSADNASAAEDDAAKLTESVAKEDSKDGSNDDKNQDAHNAPVDAESKGDTKSEENDPVSETLPAANLVVENVIMDEMQKLLEKDFNDKDKQSDEIISDPPATASTEGDQTSGETDKENVVILTSDSEDAATGGDKADERSDGAEEHRNEDTKAEQPLEENKPSSSDAGDSTPKEPSNEDAATPVQSPSLNPSDSAAPKPEASLEEVIEEPCVKRVVTPSKSVRLEKDDSTEKQVEELEKIKKVDLSQLSKDSAEALFYSLKKSELESQEPEGNDTAATGTDNDQQTADDDDQDVVVKEEPRPAPSEESTKRTFTDDFLDESPITEAPAEVATMSDDGVQQQDPAPADQDRSSLEAGEQEDEFNPMVMVSMRTKQLQEQLHSRVGGVGGEDTSIPDPASDDSTPKRPVMRRCMTEMSGLQRYDAVVDDEPVEARQHDPGYVEEEDQFDGYYIGHIKNKILASSVSVADSDCPDGTRSSVESVDENNVRTALETIASTDTESTIASQATIQQAGRRSYLRKHSQNTSSNIPYASFGNAAIDKSLDEFIEREEQHKQDEAMAEAATKIQRSYRTHKKKLLRDYHSTMRTFTEDQSAESGEECAANVIQIKLDQRRTDGSPTVPVDAGEESDTTMASHQPLGSAMQRNSTPDDDSGKSANVSTDRKPSLTSAVVADSAPASGSGESPSSDEKPAEQAATGSSSDEREQKDAQSSSRSKPKSGPASTVSGRDANMEPLPRSSTGHTSRTSFAPLDVQSLLLIARQRTMPVQIDSSVIRVLPKHMRKRISSAGMLNGNGKRK